MCLFLAQVIEFVHVFVPCPGDWSGLFRAGVCALQVIEFVH